MKTQRNVWLVLAAGLLLACSCPLVTRSALPTQPVLSTQPPLTIPGPLSDTATPALPTSTAASGAPPTATLSPTPSIPQVTPISANVNCRTGPDVDYDAVSVLLLGQTTQIAGRNEDGTWWYIRDLENPGGFCWVAANVVAAAGNVAGVPIQAPPAAIVTGATVEVNAPPSVFCGGPNPLEFSGTITTNGAATVKFQWEVSGDKSNTTSPQTLKFLAAGTKDAPDPGAFSVDCGSYSITLHILSPNDVSATKKFKVKP